MSVARRIVVGDIGGTHARFALAQLDGDTPVLGTIRKYRTADHLGLPSAWNVFAEECGEALPDSAAIALAVAIEGEVLRFPNSGWTIERNTIESALGLERLLLLNDFGAVAHAVAALPEDRLLHLAGPTGRGTGVTTVIGPGTGLGVALLMERPSGIAVVETEGGHVGFAPESEAERALETALRQKYGRCSAERVVSGPGLLDIHQAMGGANCDAAELWQRALSGSDALAGQALDMLVGALGSVAGDLSLAHGSMRVVITGGLANRMRERLAAPAFAERFAAKGRYTVRQQRVSIWLALEEEPGLLGAAVAFQRAFA